MEHNNDVLDLNERGLSHMKKAALLILTLALALSLTACGPSKNAIKKASSSSDLNLTNEQLEKLAAQAAKENK